MATKRQNDDLLYCLLYHLDQGLVVCRETRFFAESTCGLSAEDLRSALVDPHCVDRETLLLLIFSPDRAMRHAVERLLCAARFTERDVAGIVERLIACRETVPLIFEDSELSVSLPIDDELIRALIGKLGIQRPLDSEICSVLEEAVKDEEMIAARVAMRCKKIVPSDRSRAFLCTVIRKTAHLPEEFGALFELVLTLLGEKLPGVSMEHYLFGKRGQLLKTLAAIDAFARSRERYGMEYLLMQRQPVPPESEDLVRQSLALIDRLIFDLLHLVPPPGHRVRYDDFGVFNPEADLERLFRTLS